MAEAGQSNLLNNLFDLAKVWSAPLAQKIVYGGQAPTQPIVQETAQWAKLNGSGPNNTTEAARAPQGFLDFIRGINTGVSDTGATPTTKVAAGMSTQTLVIIGIAAAAVLFLISRAMSR